jgi:hypothetical protein
VTRPAEPARRGDELLQAAVVPADEHDRVQVEPGLRLVEVRLAPDLPPHLALADPLLTQPF